MQLIHRSLLEYELAICAPVLDQVAIYVVLEWEVDQLVPLIFTVQSLLNFVVQLALCLHSEDLTVGRALSDTAARGTDLVQADN